MMSANNRFRFTSYTKHWNKKNKKLKEKNKRKKKKTSIAPKIHQEAKKESQRKEGN